MRRHWNRATALLAFLLFVSACGGTSYSLTLTEEQREAVRIDGWSQTGRTDLDADDWFEIVSTTCSNQPHTEVTRSSVVAEWELDRLVPTDDAVFSLWLITKVITLMGLPPNASRLLQSGV